MAIATSQDPARLAAALEAGGKYAIVVPSIFNDGLSHAIFESETNNGEPETHFQAIQITIESSSAPARREWDACATRVFDVGNECGVKLWDFNQLISNPTLRRLVDVGASLRVTLYPNGWPLAALAAGKPKQSRRRRRS